MSETRITIDSILKNPKNWPDDVDFDGMDENHKLLGEYMGKMYFSEVPYSPRDIVFLFSVREFGLALTQILDNAPSKPATILFQEHDKIQFALKMSEMGAGFVYSDKCLISVAFQGENVFIDIAF